MPWKFTTFTPRYALSTALRRVFPSPVTASTLPPLVTGNELVRVGTFVKSGVVAVVVGIVSEGVVVVGVRVLRIIVSALPSIVLVVSLVLLRILLVLVLVLLLEEAPARYTVTAESLLSSWIFSRP